MKSKLLILLSIISIIMVGCNSASNNNEASESNAEVKQTRTESTTEAKQGAPVGEKETLLIGTNSSHIETIEKAVDIFNNQSDMYEIEIQMFDDFQTPNIALKENKLDMNFYQHRPFLEQWNEENNATLVPVNDKGVYSLQYGIYSSVYDSLDEVQEGDTAVVMNDPVNRDIQLRLLEEQGLIKLSEGDHYKGIPDIIENPLNLEIKEVDGASISNMLEDPAVQLTLAMGYGIARVGGDATGALAYSSDELTGEMVECLVVREDDQFADWATEFYDVLTGEEMENFYNDRYQGMIKVIK